MITKMFHRQIIILTILIAFSIGACTSTSIKTDSISTLTVDHPTSILTISSPTPSTTTYLGAPTPSLLDYEFPDSIQPELLYLFYVHGKIIEDQGLPAVSPDFGVYEIEAILKKLESYGFVVISEQRPKNADVEEYARRTVKQVNLLLNANVPPKNITVVGASKGAVIAALASYLLKNESLNFTLLGTCDSETIEYWKQNQMYLYGNILAIHDSVDNYAGSCQELFKLSEGKGIARQDEIVLHTGLGHGLLYQPLDEWMIPTVQFTGIILPPR